MAWVAVRLTTPELCLLLWRRRPCTDVRYEVAGDRALLVHWHQHAVIT